MKLHKLISILLLLTLTACKNGFSLNPFDPSSLLGILIGTDPFRLNPPPTPKITVRGIVSTIGEGESVTIGVSLSADPRGTKEIKISSSLAVLSVNGNQTASIKFDSANYSTEQIVALKALIDVDNISDFVKLTFSGDGLDSVDNTLLVSDDLTIVLSGTVTSLQEGQTASIGVRLSKIPPGNKDVTINANPAKVLVNGAASQTLTFTQANFSTVQTLTLLAVTDADSVNDSVNMSFTMQGAADVLYSLTVIDDNTIVVNGVPASLLEGSTATLNVYFSKTLLSANTITITSSNTNAITFNGASSATLNYGTGNSTTGQPLVIRAEEDVNLTNETVTLTFTASGMGPVTVNLSTVDNDSQNIIVTGAISTLDETQSGTISVKLNFDPGQNTTVTVTSGNTNALDVSPTSLTFTSANYNVNQTVTLTAKNDSNQTSEDVTVLFTATGATPQFYPLKTVDDDIQLSISGATTVNEGGQATILVSLSGDPGTTRTINLSSNNTAAVTLGTSVLTFTPANYSQTVIINGVQDNNIIPESVTITGTPVGSGITTANAAITTVDDDTMNISLSGLGASTINEGGSTTFKVHLTQEPTPNLTVNFTSSNPAVTLSPTSALFTSANYLTDQTITINSIQDANPDSETVTITASASGVTVSPTVQVTTIEDDTVPQISGAATVTEGGFTVLTVKLSGNPGNNRTVTVDLTGTTSSVSVSPTSFDFTPLNYSTAQTFILSGLQDMNIANENFTVRATMGALTTTFGMNTVDEDVSSFGLIVTNVSGTTTVNEGSSLQFSVKLNFEPPTSPYIVTVSAPQTSPAVPGYVNNPTYVIDPANSGAGSATLSFNNTCPGANCWSSPKTITINAPENYYIDDKTTTLTFSGAGVTSQTFNITVKDNDPIEHTLVDDGMGPSCSEVSTSYTGTNLLIGAKCSINGSGEQNRMKAIQCVNNFDYCINANHPTLSIGGDGNALSVNALYYNNAFMLISENSANGRMNYFYYTWAYKDMSASGNFNTGDNSSLSPTAVWDPINQRILVAAKNSNTNSLVLYSFDQNGSNLNTPISIPVNTLEYPKMQIDTINNKIVVLFNSSLSGARELYFIRCNLDLSGCSTITKFNDISGLFGVLVLGDYDFLIDPASNQFILSYSSPTSGSGSVPELIICNSNITTCSRTILNTAYRSGIIAKVVVDSYNSKILVLTKDATQNFSTIMYRCKMDGTACTSRNMTGWLTANAGNSIAKPFIDTVNKKLRFVTINSGMGGILSMFSMLLYID